jgi:ketosteroid isomerase-like protein
VLRSVTTLFCAALVAAVAGCGQTDQEKTREVVQDYADARGDRDFDTVCELYADSFKQQLGATENCPAFLAEQTSGLDGNEQLEIVSVHVRGDRANAALDVSGESGGPIRIGLQLERQDDGSWKITGLQ